MKSSLAFLTFTCFILICFSFHKYYTFSIQTEVIIQPPLVIQKPKPNTLIAITTCNHWEITYNSIQSLQQSTGFDILVVDDGSIDTTVTSAKELGVQVIQTSGLMNQSGVTYSWNLAYQYFKKSDYEIFFIINNDVIVPKGAIDQMKKELLENEHILIISPLTTRKGLGVSNKVAFYQAIENQFPKFPFSSLDDPNQAQAIQNELMVMPMNSTVFKSNCLGFFMGFHRTRVVSREYEPDILFNYHNPQIGQEEDLRDRGFNCYLSLRSFVFHMKAVTLRGKKGVPRQQFQCRQPKPEDIKKPAS